MKRFALLLATVIALSTQIDARPANKSATAPASTLSFSERLRAQQAIERVYYSHGLGTTLPFEQAVPGDLLNRKVQTYLKQSQALVKFWNTPITSDALAREIERMASTTRMPERLRELFSALGNDPLLIEECLARPV